jgi:putative DNA modification/repair radical SAM protein
MESQSIYDKLRVLADSAKYDVACSTSGVARGNNGRRGNTVAAGCCHSWSADGRCISLLKVLFTNRCVYNCEYCINRRSSDIERASFEPMELARLTMEFYRRNYIEGLFVSSAVEVSPDHTSERMLAALRILRREMGFAGYIHTKVIPGTSPWLVHQLGLESDRMSVNAELPTRESLAVLAPQKKPEDIFTPMKQITNTLIERKGLRGPGNMFAGEDLNSALNYLTPGGEDFLPPAIAPRKGESFVPAGQTTQMIIGADGTSDRTILGTTEKIYRTFKMKRVYFSAYIPTLASPLLPDILSAPPLIREHRLYQADWLLRFYGFNSEEILPAEAPDLDLELDPKVAWALRNIHLFPVEVNRAPLEELLRIPGVGTVSAMRILRQRRLCAVTEEDLRRMGVVLKRARHFLTCSGRFAGEASLRPDRIRTRLLEGDDGLQLSLFQQARLLETEGRRNLLDGLSV